MARRPVPPGVTTSLRGPLRTEGARPPVRHGRAAGGSDVISQRLRGLIGWGGPAAPAGAQFSASGPRQFTNENTTSESDLCRGRMQPGRSRGWPRDRISRERRRADPARSVSLSCGCRTGSDGAGDRAPEDFVSRRAGEVARGDCPVPPASRGAACPASPGMGLAGARVAGGLAGNDAGRFAGTPRRDPGEAAGTGTRGQGGLPEADSRRPPAIKTKVSTP
jgi:hypothetical protein